jgi:hypothetical protein
MANRRSIIIIILLTRLNLAPSLSPPEILVLLNPNYFSSRLNGELTKRILVLLSLSLFIIVLHHNNSFFITPNAAGRVSLSSFDRTIGQSIGLDSDRGRRGREVGLRYLRYKNEYLRANRGTLSIGPLAAINDKHTTNMLFNTINRPFNLH